MRTSKGGHQLRDEERVRLGAAEGEAAAEALGGGQQGLRRARGAQLRELRRLHRASQMPAVCSVLAGRQRPKARRRSVTEERRQTGRVAASPALFALTKSRG
jgi:hypothetical protein